MVVRGAGYFSALLAMRQQLEGLIPHDYDSEIEAEQRALREELWDAQLDAQIEDEAFALDSLASQEGDESHERYEKQAGDD